MNKTDNQKKCYHESPHKDENPEFFEYDDDARCNNEFGDLVQYKCKYCGYELLMDIFTEECKVFEEEFNRLHPSES